MTSEEKIDIILSKLTNLEQWQSKLEQWQSKLEQWQSKLEQRQSKLEQRMSKLEYDIWVLRDDFIDFKDELWDNFENINKLIDQSFEKINENIAYQDKVIEIEKIIHSRNRTFN